MNNFTYRSNEEKDNLEAILRRRKRKFNTQQWVARIIMLIIVASVAFYVANNVYYTQYDGYVHVDENKVRAPFDIYLDGIYVHTGDIVYPGDTLYSYYAINTMVERANPNRIPAIQSSSREIKIKARTAAREISVLQVHIAELRKQIAVENHNIALGLSSNSHRLDLERDLSEAQARLNALHAERAMYSRMLGSLPHDIIGEGADSLGMSMVFDDIRSRSGVSLPASLWMCASKTPTHGVSPPTAKTTCGMSPGAAFRKASLLRKPTQQPRLHGGPRVVYTPVLRLASRGGTLPHL